MFKKWIHLFAKEKAFIQIQIEKEPAKKHILDFVGTPTDEEVLTRDLMNGLLKFREDTSSLDYLRTEIEEVLHQKDGEITLMEGFAHAMKQQKK